MYINTLRQHILISGITLLLTVWLFLLLGHIFDKQIEKDYPDLAPGDIFVEKNLLDQWAQTGNTKTELRGFVLQQLMQSGFTGFVTKPYEDSPNDVHITTRNNSYTGDLIVESLPDSLDPLDTHIDSFLSTYNDTEYQVNKKPYIISGDDYQLRTGLYLFKTTQDLENMGYTLVSHRSRINTDAAYRRHNIATALDQFGAVRIVLPGEELSFLEEINYDPHEQELYKAGFTVVLDEDQTEYGGGLCGASTAVYQGLLTNTAIQPAERRAHTQRYGYLYDAQVNGETITTPGLDSTIYDGHIDYKIKNTAPYPIIVVSNYDGTSGGIEEVFSLAKTEHKGSFEHDYARPNRSTIIDKGVSRVVRGGCYGRIINGEERESCYKQVK